MRYFFKRNSFGVLCFVKKIHIKIWKYSISYYFCPEN